MGDEPEYTRNDALAKMREMAANVSANTFAPLALGTVVDVTAKAEAQGLLSHLPQNTHIELCVNCHTIHVRRPDGPQNLWTNHDAICAWVQRSFPVQEA